MLNPAQNDAAERLAKLARSYARGRPQGPVSVMPTAQHQISDDLRTLLEERERYREALGKIKTGEGMFQPVGAGDGDTYVVSEVTFMRRAQEIARQALGASDA